MSAPFTPQDRKHMLELLAKLVSCATENNPPNGYEEPGQAILEEFYRKNGLKIDRFSPEDVPDYPENPEFMPRNFKGRKNLVGVWKGRGEGRSLLITGHMDVAPKEPMPWTVTQPYVPLIKDGKMYGRGAADMKAGLVCAAMAIAKLKEEGFQPRGDVIVESVVDEEFAGANGTIASRLKGYNTDFAIITEPNGLNVCPACVGGLIVQLSIQGIGGMPYTGEKIPNPAYDIAELVLLMREFSQLRMRTAPKPPLWEGTVQGAQVSITKVRAGEAYPHGQLSTPIDAWMEFVIQTYPGESAEEVLTALKDFLRQNYAEAESVKISLPYHYCRPAASDPEEEGVQMLAKCAARHTDLSKICGCMFSCDMFALTQIGQIPSVVFGPFGERLHAPDEWVDIDSMEICVKTLMDFIREWCA